MQLGYIIRHLGSTTDQSFAAEIERSSKMIVATESLTQPEREQREWEAWQKAQAERRAKLGYDEPVSDDEALDVLGLL